MKPFTGRVVYAEDVGGGRYTFYAPQVWMRQRRIYMPTATIKGTIRGNPVDASFSRADGCEIERWARVEPLLSHVR